MNGKSELGAESASYDDALFVWKRRALEAEVTVAHQAQMIDQLKISCATPIDMGAAASDGRRSLYEYLMEKLAVDFPDSETTMTVECFADWMSKEVKP
jgi:hypothetical protein